jgi:hypothetical protein
MNRLLSFGLVLAAGTTLAQNAAAPTFLLRPELNKPYKWKISMDTSGVETPQGSFQLAVTLVSTVTFTEATPEQVKSKQKTSDFQVKLNGSPLPLPQGEDPNQSVEIEVVQKPNGELISRTVNNSMMTTPMRFEKLMELTFPAGEVKPGESWTREVKEDKAQGITAARGKVTYAADEVVQGRTLARFDVAYSELTGQRPMGMIGKAWVEKSTGLPYRIEATMNDVSLSEMMPPTNMSFLMTRVN